MTPLFASSCSDQQLKESIANLLACQFAALIRRSPYQSVSAARVHDVGKFLLRSVCCELLKLCRSNNVATRGFGVAKKSQ